MEALAPEIECAKSREQPSHKEIVKSWSKVSYHSGLEIKDDHLSDRGVYATENIQPGSMLICERAYATHLEFRNFILNCYNCLKRLVTPVGCRNCSVILYCNKACEEESWKKGEHRLECETFTGEGTKRVIDNFIQISNRIMQNSVR